MYCYNNFQKEHQSSDILIFFLNKRGFKLTTENENIFMTNQSYNSRTKFKWKAKIKPFNHVYKLHNYE